MISETVGLVTEVINDFYFSASTDPPLILGNVARYNDGDEFSNSLNDKLILSVVNFEEDRIAKSPKNFITDNSLIQYKQPPIPVNLTVLFASTHGEYNIALFYVEQVIRYFQLHPVLTPDNTQKLRDLNDLNDFHIERITFEWVNLNLEQVNQLWTSLGGHYMPSVVYKMRMLIIDSNEIQREAPPIKNIDKLFKHKK